MTAAKAKSRFSLPGLAPGPRRRPARVADAIRGEIAGLLIRGVKDPRVRQVTITTVEVSDDLRRARVYYSTMDQAAAADAAAGLASARGFIRSHLARELGLRYVPELEFRHDDTMARQEKLERLLREVENGNESSP